MRQLSPNGQIVSTGIGGKRSALKPQFWWVNRGALCEPIACSDPVSTVDWTIQESQDLETAFLKELLKVNLVMTLQGGSFPVCLHMCVWIGMCE